jgi:hypothetical protein
LATRQVERRAAAEHVRLRRKGERSEIAMRHVTVEADDI